MKWVVRILIVLVLLVVVVVAAAVFYIDSLTRHGVEQATQHATGCTTTLEGAHVGLFAGEASLTGLDIANPEGFPSEQFLGLGKIEAAIDLGSLLEDTVVIPKIALTDFAMTLESDGERNNYDVVFENLKKLGGEGGEEEPEPAESDEPGKKYVVEHILLENIVVTAEVPSLGKEPNHTTVTIPRVELRDVGSDTESGVLLSQLSGVILDAVFRALLENPGDIPAVMLTQIGTQVEALGELGNYSIEVIEGVGGAATEVVGEVAGQAGQVVGEAQKTVEGAGKAVDEVGKTVEGLGGILGGKKKQDDAAQEQDTEQ